MFIGVAAAGVAIPAKSATIGTIPDLMAQRISESPYTRRLVLQEMYPKFV